MIFVLYILRGIPKETSDPQTKEPYGVSLILHVIGEVITTVVELLMAIIAFDIVLGGFIPADLKECLVDCMANGLMYIVPGICVLITGLIYSGVMVER